MDNAANDVQPLANLASPIMGLCGCWEINYFIPAAESLIISPVYHGDLWILKKSLTSQIIPRVQSPLESAELWS